MAEWAYPCRLCGTEEGGSVYVSAAMVAELPARTRMLQVRIDDAWHCATLDRSQRVAVDRMLLREAVPADTTDCPECAPPEGAADEPHTAEESAGDAPPRTSGRTVQAAAISLRGRQMVVVLVSPALLDTTAEADLAIESVAPSFGGAPVILVAQRDDGSPRYHGDPVLLEILEGIPLERMPWKAYPLR